MNIAEWGWAVCACLLSVALGLCAVTHWEDYKQLASVKKATVYVLECGSSVRRAGDLLCYHPAPPVKGKEGGGG